MDDQGHGSHCAGIVAGTGASGTKTGMAPGAKIMALKVLGADGSGSNSNIMNAMQYAIDNRANIVSMSLGASGDSGNASERQLFVNMLNVGMIATLAAGNDGENYSNANPNGDGHYYSVPRNVGSPGNCPPPWHNPDQTLSGGLSAVVCVGASNRNDRKSTFSSMGPVTWSGVSGYNDYPYTSGSSTNIGLIRPDIAVPGSDITSLNYSGNSGYTEMCGTSMATPGCAGIFALMLSANPDLTPAQLDEIIETTAIPSDFQTGKNNNTGAGRADALAAIDAIFTTATKPTNLSITTCGGNVNLTWTASTAPAGYCIYRDNVQVATNVSETSYTDENVGVGKHIYYVRANDGSNRQSVHSNCVVCTIEPYASVPMDFGGELNGNSIDLSWQTSTVSNAPTETTLCFTDDTYTAFGSSGSSTINFGVRYLPEDLVGLKGMSIDKVSLPIYTTGISYTLRIFRGTTYSNTTGAAVYTQSFTPTSGNWEYQTMNLNTPYVLDDVSQDLWITFSAKTNSGGGYPMIVGLYEGSNSNCFYQAFNSNVNGFVWTHYPDYGSNYNYALCIQTHLTRTTTYSPVYNVYRNDEGLAQNLTGTSYNDASPTIENSYYVTAKVGDNESCPSQAVEIIIGGIEITATANPSSGGTITGIGSYIEGATATLTATPNLGYAFVNWTENNQVVSTNATYSFTVNEPLNLVANFQSIPKNNIAYASVENGTVCGPTAAYPGETVTLTASPASGYVLASWNVYKTGDPSTTIVVEDNQLVMPNYDVTVSAEFIVNPEYSINLPCSIAFGSITTSHNSAIAGTTITLTATPEEGYELNSWIVTKTDNPSVMVSVSDNSFIMPNYDVNVTVLFTAEEVEDTYFVGTEETLSSNSNIPTNLYYKYSLSQSIYTPAQLGTGACTITHIAYYYNATTAADRTVEIYMSHTATASFGSTKAWINPSSSDKVFSGTFSISGEVGWKLIELGTPFEYNGTDNLVITFDDNSGNYKSSGLNFYTFNSENNTSIYYYSDNTNPNPTNVTQTASGRLAYIPILALILDVEQPGSASLTTLPCGLSGLDYYEGNGPSEAKPVTILSAYLDNEIVVTAPSHYEVSSSIDGTYAASITIPAAIPQPGITTYSFDTDLEGWTTLDKDSDGFDWFHSSDYANHCINNQPGANSGAGYMVSMSYDNCAKYSALTPENYLVSPEIDLGGFMSFYAAEANSEYGPEVLGVYVSTSANPNQFTQVGADININHVSYAKYDIDLSAYSGRGHVAICHHNCTDVFYVTIDDITIGGPGASPSTLPNEVYVGSVYARLKSNLAVGQYNDETLTITSDELSAEVTLNGEVTDPLHIVSDNQTIDGNLVLSESNRYLITGTGVLTVNGTISGNDPSLLVIADGGQLIHNNEGVQATIQKSITGYEADKDYWYLIASPVTDNTFVTHLVSNKFDLYTFDQTEELEWRNQHQNAVVEHKSGYLYANSEDVTLEFNGSIAANAVATPIAYNEGYAFTGFNLIGNPYPCNAYISNSYLRMNAGGTALEPGTGAIAPCEAVFVEASAEGQSVEFGKIATRINAINVSIAQSRGTAVDRAIVRFDGKDNLHKMTLSNDYAKLYIPQSGEEFAAVSSQSDEGEIPVNFKAAKNGTYTINVDTENVDVDYLHLIDNLTGEDTDLLANSSKGSGSYTFKAKTSDYTSRFKLVFKVSVENAESEDGNFAFISNGNLIINNAKGGSTLQIIDALGRVLRSENLEGRSSVSVDNIRAGIYVLRLINGEKVLTQKLVRN